MFTYPQNKFPCNVQITVSNSMSFNRLNYDTCTYTHNLRQTIGVSDYILNAPQIDCQSCFSTDPMMRQDKRGGASCKSTAALVDASSDLLGITRKATNCPLQQYLPTSNKVETCELSTPGDCPQMPRENTRLSNPPCTLRGTGWNRWEWLCRDPQDKALVPFDYNINYRMVVKDNHRPCIPCPLNPAASLPPANNQDTVMQTTLSDWSKGPDETLPSVHWRTCSGYKPYTTA